MALLLTVRLGTILCQLVLEDPLALLPEEVLPGSILREELSLFEEDLTQLVVLALLSPPDVSLTVALLLGRDPGLSFLLGLGSAPLDVVNGLLVGIGGGEVLKVGLDLGLGG